MRADFFVAHRKGVSILEDGNVWKTHFPRAILKKKQDKLYFYRIPPFLKKAVKWEETTMAALFSKNKVVGKVVDLPIEEIQANPAQPRMEFDAYELIALSESIRQNGLLQPITVRKLEEGGYELISGERRLRASKLARFSTIHAIVVESSEEQSAVFALLENIQRQDLNCFEQARGIKKLMECWHVTQEETARRLGIAQSTLANKLRLLGLDREVQDCIVSQKLSERHARALLQVGKEKRLSVAQLVAQRHYSVVQTEDYIARMAAEDAATAARQRNRFIVKDVRIFLNTVDKAIDLMKQAGVDAQASTVKGEEYIEYNIRIPLKKRKKESA